MARFPKELVAGLCAAVRDRRRSDRPTLVAVDGPGCSGKSSLVEEMCQSMGEAVADVGMDSFFVPFASQTLAWKPGEDFSRGVPHLRWSEIETVVLDCLARGHEASYRPYAWEADVLGAEETIPASRMVVVEGLYSLHARLRHAYDFKIWVDCNRHDRMARVVARDGDRFIRLWRDLYVPREQAYIARCKPHDAADVIVLGAGLESLSTRQTFAWTGR